MVIKTFSVTLNDENVSKAKEIIKSSGGKLSPILDLLLEKWVKEQEKEEEVEDGNTN